MAPEHDFTPNIFGVLQSSVPWIPPGENISNPVFICQTAKRLQGRPKPQSPKQGGKPNKQHGWSK